MIKKGCFGTVYRGRLSETGKIIALKQILVDKSHKSREEELCRRLKSPFIVKVIDTYHTNQENQG